MATTPRNQPASATQPGYLTTGAQDVAGVKTFNDGIKLDDAAGQSTLSHYTTTTSTVAMSGATTAPNMTVKCSRIGNIVTIRIPSFAAVTKDGSTGALTWAAIIPDGYRPPSNYFGFIAETIFNGSLGSVGWFIDTAGTLYMYANDGYASIPANTANNALPYSIAVTYIVD